MANPEMQLHDDPDLFQAAIDFTAVETGFNPRLIEKDYFCTRVLEHMSARDPLLVFKGGTCLAKVHAGFYRLSEDLDFCISVPVNLSRNARSTSVRRAKSALEELPNAQRGFRSEASLTGTNDSTQYNGIVVYDSLLNGEPETIRLEVGVREPLMETPTMGATRTILLDPISGEEAVPPIQVACISQREAFAEKCRAALSRREPAIRDFFDIDYAVRNLGLAPQHPDFVYMVRAKMSVPGNDAADVSDGKLVELRRQVAAQLKPVLRDRDFVNFDLSRAFQIVRTLAESL